MTQNDQGVKSPTVTRISSGSSPGALETRVFIRDHWRTLSAFDRQVALVTPGRRGGATITRTYADLRQRAAHLASNLLQQGVEKGDRVALFSENSEDWILLDLALQTIGAVVVPRSSGASTEELHYILDHSDAVGLVVESEKLAQALNEAATTRSLKCLIVLQDPRKNSLPQWQSLEAFLKSFPPPNKDPETWLRDKARQVSEEDLATLVYTSGTTGQPKGVMLTQKNLGINVQQAAQILGVVSASQTYLSILPPWHAFERIAEYVLSSLGLTLVYSDRRNLREDLKRWRPHAFAGVPRVWMMLGDGIQQAIQKLPSRQKSVVKLATKIALIRTRAIDGAFSSKTRWSRFLHRLKAQCLLPLEWLARSFVFRPLLERAGLDNLSHGIAISGGGSLPKHVDEYFCNFGLNLLNGYGLTETSPVLSVRIPGAGRLSTVGPPLPETEIQILSETDDSVPHGEPGRLIVRGPQVMKGYWKDSESTASVKDEDGWFDTGDLARLTPDGHLEITGRAKDTIVLLNGENIEPEPIENAILQSKLIQQAIVVGQDQKHLGALVVVEETLEGLREDPQTLERLKTEIDRLVSRKNGFASHERIHRIDVLERPLSVEEGTLSMTLKPRRHQVMITYQERLTRMFQNDGPPLK